MAKQNNSSTIESLIAIDWQKAFCAVVPDETEMRIVACTAVWIRKALIFFGEVVERLQAA